jgi:RTX calcium-binding nonapeptide repeat (4 copies)
VAAVGVTRIALSMAIALVFAIASPLASAGVVSVVAKRNSSNHCITCAWNYVAAPGEVNHVTLSQPSFETLRIEDTAAPVAAGNGCTAEPGGHAASCDVSFGGASGGYAFTMNLRDGDDVADVPELEEGGLIIDAGSGADRVTGDATIFGGPGNDTIIGGGASSQVSGGGGNDFVDVSNDPPARPLGSNDWVDDVDCEAPSSVSHDTVKADSGDNVAPGCHVIGNPHRRVRTQHADSDTADVGGFEFDVSYGTELGGGVFVLTHDVPARLRGRVGFDASCLAHATCSGRLMLRLPHHGALIGTGSYRVRSGRQHTAVAARLNARGIAQLGRHKTLPAEVYVDPARGPITYGDELTLLRA